MAVKCNNWRQNGTLGCQIDTLAVVFTPLITKKHTTQKSLVF